MPYAVLQTELDKPTVEQMARAFRSVPGLTPADAQILGNDAFGILVKNFSGPQASTLQGALRIEGVETEVVDQSLLPALPATHFVQRLECKPEHLLIYDPSGRSFALDWRNIAFIAAGAVRLTEFVQRQKARTRTRYIPNAAPLPETEYETVSREERNLHLLGEIIITGATLRYSFQADKFDFSSLGGRDKKNPAANFALLVRDLVQFGAGAALNRGAEAIQKGDTAGFSYPSQHAFYEEIVWSLWQLKKVS